MEGLFFLLLAIGATWPLARHATDHLPLGTEPAATVPLFNTWTIWWNSDRIAAGYQDYWHAPIFFPAKGAFAFSEPQPLTVVAAPIIWLTGNRILAYNGLLILFLWLNGWIACRILQTFRLHPLPALAGGAFVSLLAVLHSWLGVLQLVPVFGILLSIQALYFFSRLPTIPRGIMLGLSLALSYLLCSYYGLFLVIVLAIPGIWFSFHLWKNRQFWLSLGIGTLVFIACSLPIMIGQAHFLSPVDRSHDNGYLALLSARPGDYLRQVWPSTFFPAPDAKAASASGFRLNSSYLQMALAASGIIMGLRSYRRRQVMLFVAIGAIAFFLSLGPRLSVGEFRPYLVLVEWVPGLAQARNIFRFALLTNLMIALLAAIGLQVILRAGRRLKVIRTARNASFIMVALLGLAASTEQLPPAQPLYRPPGNSANNTWLQQLRNFASDGDAVVCLPFAFKPDVVSYEKEALWMYWQTFHQRPLLNGYSGFFPSHFSALKWPMAEFPTGDSLHLLRKFDIDLVVVDRTSPQGMFIRSKFGSDRRLEPLFHDDQAAIDIYRLRATVP